MTTTSDSVLVSEFLADHRLMLQLLVDLAAALDDAQLERARTVAHELNRVAGPHIQYEESELYPRVSRMGVALQQARSMYYEHRQVIVALRLLLETHSPSPETVREISSGIRIGIDHAHRCGSLVSLLAEMPLAEQAQSLEVLRDYRRRNLKWTELLR